MGRFGEMVNIFKHKPCSRLDDNNGSCVLELFVYSLIDDDIVKCCISPGLIVLHLEQSSMGVKCESGG